MGKSSYQYEKERNTKQIRMVFNMDDHIDSMIYHYAKIREPNRTSYIKRLIYEDMVRYAHENK